MLCPVCDLDSREETCSRCGGALALKGRFRLERLLGSGGQSRVYVGRDAHDGSAVAVKIMSLDRVRDWKNVELFRRAAQVLAGLHHPGIPRLVEYFEDQRPGAALLCLVHELIDGETLAEAMKHGLRFDEPSARALLVELLGILSYLQSFSPPVIHRDLKPSNLMRRRDGRLVLIDFDLVRDVMTPDGGATTTAGTAGYTPLEQYAGEALPASDLYAAGATLAALLSRKEPLELRAPGGQRLALGDHIRVSPRFLAVLTKMVEPEVQRRYQSAAEVLADLERPEKPAAGPRPPIPR
jgi:serine/threonine protein kinase